VQRFSEEERTVGILCGEEERTVGILCGESVKSHEPLDIMEEQGSYNECFERF
jgi:hypothetical protein